MDATLDAPSGAAALKLRSQMLFLNQPRQDPENLVLSTFAWNYRYLHETNHWARYHGSSAGVLLTLLRRSRDALASYFLETLESEERRHLLEQRQSGHLFGQPSGVGSLSGPNGARLEQDWLALYFTHQALMGGVDPARAGGIAVDWAFSRALHLTWFNSESKGMLKHPDGLEPHLTAAPASAPSPADVEIGRLNTRLLFECAAVLDETYMHTLGSVREVIDPALWNMTAHTFEGDYGLAYRIAERLAGRDVGAGCVLALIDFALNPVVPGLHRGVAAVTWDELQPVRRFAIAARSLADHRSDLEHAHPTSELLGAFHADIETATGLRVGRVDSELSSATSLQGAARQPVHFTEIIPNMTLTYARKLHEERRAAPCSITFFGLNFVNEGALRFVRPETWLIGGNWWLFPPLQVSVGQYHWPAERISQDDATNLFLGAALSSALDDIVHGAGPLTKSHLPEAILHDTAERKAINQELQEFTGLPLAW